MKIKTRLYIEKPLRENLTLDIVAPQLHFLKNVMRIKEGDYISVFNGKDGEYLAQITEVKNKFILAECQKQLKEQKCSSNIKLYFGSTNKHRLAFLVEKATELGVSELQPIITSFGDSKLFKEDKMRLQVIEAAEQCERLDVPKVHDAIKLRDIKDDNLILFADESRVGDNLFSALSKMGSNQEVSIIIGPAGGFSAEEKDFINNKLDNIKNISLGDNILRVETAVIMILSCLVANQAYH
ncbi:MAG: 16S rRNA (uracil(1498)-N(3))-methyltransferase [Alphaproteobacteria bacterium]|nr:16S rRNA (uracil(1498)-N(3))-methyltransferase [Alphaproteobacteria bacterium]